MRTMGATLTVLALVASAAPAAAQQSETCLYEGRRFASGQVICQSGQVQTCIGGEWQGNGSFCDGGSNGAYIGTRAMNPGAIDRNEGYRVPVQNAPIHQDENAD
jgi:hypothetical protein